MRVGLAVVLIAMMPGLALAQSPPRGYPEAAWRQGLGGTVLLRCTAENGRRIRDCSVVSERPAGLGFGAAALKLQPSLPPSRGECGSLLVCKVTFPVEFRPTSAAASPDAGSQPR